MLYAEAGEIPLKERANMLAKKEAIKIFAHNKPLIDVLSKFKELTDLPKKHTFLEKITYENNYIVIQTNNTVINLESRRKIDTIENLKINTAIHNLNKQNMNEYTIKAIINEYVSKNFSNHIKIYTDGSKTSASCGIGIWIDNEETLSCRVNQDLSIKNVELIAINTAIDLINNRNEDQFVICSDSKSGLLSLKNKNVKNNYIISEILLKLSKTSKSITLQWVPGHKGITGNEKADGLSKEGCNSKNVIYTKLTLADALNLVKNETIQEWNNYYTILSHDKGQKHFKIYPNPTLKPWFNDLSLETHEIINLGRLRTFHTMTRQIVSMETD